MLASDRIQPASSTLSRNDSKTPTTRSAKSRKTLTVRTRSNNPMEYSDDLTVIDLEKDLDLFFVVLSKC